MIILGIVLSFAAIGILCWLLFTLAVFALPFFAGVTAGTWAYDTGAGWLGADARTADAGKLRTACLLTAALSHVTSALSHTVTPWPQARRPARRVGLR